MMFTKPNVTVLSVTADSKDDYVCLQIGCTCCGEGYIVGTTESGYIDWLEGALIQDAMPEMDKSIREMFISGTCPECWTDMYGSGTDPRDFS
jgi:hypothetical protein